MVDGMSSRNISVFTKVYQLCLVKPTMLKLLFILLVIKTYKDYILKNYSSSNQNERKIKYVEVSFKSGIQKEIGLSKLQQSRPPNQPRECRQNNVGKLSRFWSLRL